MRILGAMLGGTISSAEVSGTIKLGETSFVKQYLTDNFPEHEFVFPTFITYSSENATPQVFKESLRSIAGEAVRSGAEGILITHGTDTCAYFAQLAARVLAILDIPFVITGSMRSPDIDPDEASGNLEYSVRTLESGKSGAVFRNKQGKAHLYKAYLIMSPGIDGVFSEYSDGIIPEIKDHSDFLSGFMLPSMLMIPAVPGALITRGNYDRVLICCNHSGTASTGLVPLVRSWSSMGIKCYMAPVPTKGGVYESRQRLRDAGVIELPGMPAEGAWAEVLLR